MDILIVEDEQSLLETLIDWLEDCFPGLEIVGTGSVEDALEALDPEAPPKLVISDLRLPGKSGLDFIVEFHENYPRTRVILMSAYDLPPSASTNGGMVRFLKKPFPLGKLTEEVTAALHVTTFKGQIHGISVVEILQILDLGKRTAKLRVHFRGRDGEIFVVDGNPVHAVAGKDTGREAFRRIVGWAGGGFALESDVQTNDRTIDKRMGALLLELAQEQDEGNWKESMEALGDSRGALAGVGDWTPSNRVSSDLSPEQLERLGEICRDMLDRLPDGLLARIVDPVSCRSLASHPEGGLEHLEPLVAQTTGLFTASLEPIQETRISTASLHLFVTRIPDRQFVLVLAVEKDCTIGMAFTSLRKAIVEILGLEA